jgi:hypothetical protein
MKRFRGFRVLVTLSTLGMLSLLLTPQLRSQDPGSWPDLSLPEFVQEINRITGGTEPVSQELWAEIRRQSAQRLLGAVDTGAPADYGDLVSLFLWSRPVLTAAQVTTVLASLQPTASEIGSWPFEKLQRVHAQMLDSQMPQRRWTR